MAAGGDDNTLIKIAVFGITFSIIATIGLTLMWNTNDGYAYEDIASARSDLIDFSGQTMINHTPWKLVGVATPWVSTDGVEGHLDPDGWLYGEYYSTSEEYSYIGQSANIKLNPDRKSSVPISVSQETVEYTVDTGYKWWALPGVWWSPISRGIGEFFGQDPIIHSDRDATIWNYTGFRYIFDNMLPFSDGTSAKDGALSIVWYSYNNQEGLSGGLQVYGDSVVLSSYSAADIVAGYNQTNAYATTYDFNFNGILLTLSIRFDPDAIESGMPLMQAWTEGHWSMAISSVSAGNFYDLENSAAFAHTAGGVVQTFIDIYTWDLPQVNSSWAKLLMWLLVGLPMTIAMLCVSLRMLSGVTRIFGV